MWQLDVPVGNNSAHLLGVVEGNYSSLDARSERGLPTPYGEGEESEMGRPDSLLCSCNAQSRKGAQRREEFSLLPERARSKCARSTAAVKSSTRPCLDGY